jgi:hypothetical protein
MQGVHRAARWQQAEQVVDLDNQFSAVQLPSHVYVAGGAAP